MASDVTMPRLSDSMEEGTVLKWLVDEGGEVKRGEPLVEIETDKANMTYESDTDGTLIEVVAQEGDTLAIGEVIARIGDPSEAGGNGKPAAKEEEPAEEEAGEEAAAEEAGEGRAEAAAGEEAAGEEGEEAAGEESEEAAGEEGEEPAGEEREKAGAVAEADKGETRGRAGAAEGGGETQAGDGGGAATKTRAPSGNGAGAGERVKASPVARRMARELGVELARLEGSGPGGRIVKADVQAAAKGDGAAVEAPAREEERAPAVEEERPPAAEER